MYTTCQVMSSELKMPWPSHFAKSHDIRGGTFAQALPRMLDFFGAQACINQALASYFQAAMIRWHGLCTELQLPLVPPTISSAPFSKALELMQRLPTEGRCQSQELTQWHKTRLLVFPFFSCCMLVSRLTDPNSPNCRESPGFVHRSTLGAFLKDGSVHPKRC